MSIGKNDTVRLTDKSIKNAEPRDYQLVTRLKNQSRIKFDHNYSVENIIDGSRKMVKLYGVEQLFSIKLFEKQEERKMNEITSENIEKLAGALMADKELKVKEVVKILNVDVSYYQNHKAEIFEKLEKHVNFDMKFGKLVYNALKISAEDAKPNASDESFELKSEDELAIDAKERFKNNLLDKSKTMSIHQAYENLEQKYAESKEIIERQKKQIENHDDQITRLIDALENEKIKNKNNQIKVKIADEMIAKYVDTVDPRIKNVFDDILADIGAVLEVKVVPECQTD